MANKKIGIIGGQGPVSTADMYMRIINNFQSAYGAKNIGDYPPMLIASLPTDDLISGLETKDWLVKQISPSIKLFDDYGAEIIAIACNTLHAIYDELAKLTDTHIIHLPNTVAQEVARQNYKCVGILGTNTTVQHRLYESHLDDHSIKYLYPESFEQNELLKLIYQINAGEIIDQTILPALVNHLSSRGADAVVLACTELPTILDNYNLDELSAKLIDCNEIYAQEIARLAHGK